MKYLIFAIAILVLLYNVLGEDVEEAAVEPAKKTTKRGILGLGYGYGGYGYGHGYGGYYPYYSSYYTPVISKISYGGYYPYTLGYHGYGGYGGYGGYYGW